MLINSLVQSFWERKKNLLFFLFIFEGRVSLCSHGYPGTYCVHQVDLKLGSCLNMDRLKQFYVKSLLNVFLIDHIIQLAMELEFTKHIYISLSEFQKFRRLLQNLINYN